MKIAIVLLGLSLGFHARAEVLVTAGSDKITSEEFSRKLEELRKQSPVGPSPEVFLEELIRFDLGVQEATKLKLQNDPQVKERFKQVLYNSLLEKQLGKKIDEIKVTENELREYYKNNPELRVAHILIEIKGGAKADALKRAQEALEEAKKGKKPFEDLVRQYSDDAPTKEQGGDIGFQSRMTLVPALYDAALTMKPNEVRGVIETHFGYHVLKLIERRAFDLTDKRQLRAVIFDEKRSKVFNDYFDKLKKQYKIQVNKEALKSLVQ